MKDNGGKCSADGACRGSVSKELHSLDNMIKRYLDKHSHKANIDDIITGPNNGRIIGFLARNNGQDIYQRDIEREFCITRSTASKVLTLMEQKGLVERLSVPHDARLKKLVLTEKAHTLTELMHSDFVQAEKTLTGGFSPDEIETLYSFIERMKKNVSDEGQTNPDRKENTI